MNRVISVFLHMIQSLDVTWRVFVSFLAAVVVTCLVLFVFFSVVSCPAEACFALAAKNPSRSHKFLYQEMGKGCNPLQEKNR